MRSFFKKSSCLCALFLVTSIGFAQSAKQAVQASMFHNDVSTQAILQKNLNRILKANIEGTPYYDETFNSAKISPIDKVFMIRYNVALDVMEVIQQNDTVVMVKENRNYVIKQNKGNITYKILENVEAKEDKLGYYVQLTNGENIKLYRKDRKKFVEAKAAAYGNINKTSAKYKEQKSEFYIEYGDSGSAVKLPKKKKSLIKLFASKQGDIKSFIKKNKIKVTKEQDLVRLINYANSL
ncbi:hypothetical protein KORDIASMS9_00721 [Kordia sp. SMS9]|uniref:hypothetical protein n=1 Tax=Kordia sp. SMS9 TaxID=2282170 RepID=UPI000E10AB1C|nr:hypothetical protein [Kordia sp. SMS9]AXG68506.1 hypothetical protein KORDIASMS9_00721 [Kordia sp. SMS9]